MKNAGRLSGPPRMVMRVILGVLLVSLPGQSRRLVRGCDHGGIAIAPAIAALLWLAAAVFDGLQATASFALRAQGMVAAERDPSQTRSSWMIPVCCGWPFRWGAVAAGC